MSIVFCVPQFKIGLELLQNFLHWKYKYISRFETSVHMTQGANMNHVHIKCNRCNKSFPLANDLNVMLH